MNAIGKTLDIDRVVLIGEYTTPDGPDLDDHFIFVLDSSGNEHLLSSEDSDSLDWLRRVADDGGFDHSLELCHRTDFSSRVIYPSELKEKALFRFERKDMGFFRKIVSLGIAEHERTYSEEVAQYLESKGR